MKNTYPRRRFLVGMTAGCVGMSLVGGARAAAPLPTGVGLPEIDGMMTEFMETHDVRGASLAVAKQGRLVHARGYGFADAEGREAILPQHRFRIASVSKPLTAVAILRLCQTARLRTTDRVVDILQLTPEDPRWRSITIDHLLKHIAGFDSGASFDPMFRDHDISQTMQIPLPVSQDAIIAYMLKRPLDFDPGSRYAYSNFGYLLLGKVIEQLSSDDYESFVRQQVLKPLGVESMSLGRTATSDAAENEVHYRGDAERTYASVLSPERPQVPGPYGRYQLEPMAAHGGWLATATDLVRFGAALQGFVSPAPLTKRWLQTMVRAPEFHDPAEPVHYGCGVSVRTLAQGKLNLWHNGSLDGTNSLWVLRHDGFTWAALFNQRHGQDRKQLSSLIDPLLHRAVDSVQRWPSRDLFERFL